MGESEGAYWRRVSRVGCGLALAALCAFGSALAFMTAARALADKLTGND